MLLYVHWFSVNLKEYTQIAVKVFNDKYFVLLFTFAFTYKLSGCDDVVDSRHVVGRCFTMVVGVSNIQTMVFTKEGTKL